jgi:glycogen synthase
MAQRPPQSTPSYENRSAAAHESVQACSRSQMNVLVTGNPLFLRRHQQLFDALALHFAHVDRLPERPFSFFRRAVYKVRSALYQRGARSLLGIAERFAPLTAWDARVFAARSLATEAQIVQLERTPDLVFHVFGMYCPFWRRQTAPYAMILDYTASLAKRNYPEWTPFATDRSWRAWLDCEQQAYSRAAHLFPFGEQTRRSLIDDYGIDSAKITAIGSSGHFSEPYTGARTFGTKRILFYSSDNPDLEFLRKGGDLVLAAFSLVRQQVPEAKLAFVGNVPAPDGPGIENHGYVSSDKMRELFLSSDLVVAPSRCDPFPGFLIEAMNCGVPCVGSDADGIPEIIDHGITGVVVPKPSDEGLAAAVVTLLQDPQRLSAMSERGRQKVRDKLNWTSIAQVMVDKIAEVPAIRERAEQPPTALVSEIN